MPNPELVKSWAVTLRHLAACRFYLPELLPMGDARSIERELAHYLHHNEFGLALGEADALGELCSAPGAFWKELQLAARNMNMVEEEKLYAKRSES